jgi:SWI/SNF-related matrix-associated actin-dependent regulator of chromatin subfamily A3
MVTRQKYEEEMASVFWCPRCHREGDSDHSGMNLDGADDLVEEEEKKAALKRRMAANKKEGGGSKAMRRSDENDNALAKPLSALPMEPALLKGRSKATLIVCPMSLISHWVQQISQHIRDDVSYTLCVHYGNEKATSVAVLESSDVVITTYGTLSSEYGHHVGGKKTTSSRLLQAKWLRVVLDEGHQIKNPNAKMTKAAMTLKTDRKWILSGTPIQNNLEELYSLINWLGVRPFSQQPKAYWNREIALPVKKGDSLGLRALQLLLSAICLRRTKADRLNGRPIVDLPDKVFYSVEVVLAEGERAQYAKLAAEGKNIIAAMMKEGTLFHNYVFVLTVIMRLRQFCCHPQLLPEHIRNSLTHDIGVGGGGGDEDVLELDCDVCLQPLDSSSDGGANRPVLTRCRHVFCQNCLTDEDETCPTCSAPVDRGLPLQGGGTAETDEDAQTVSIQGMSSKMTSIVDVMERIRRENPGDKMVVVSQFTSFLSAMEPVLEKLGVSYLRFDGSMTSIRRATVISSFSDRDNPASVLLLSLKAGGVGLNLVSANHLLLLDPTWNPSVEAQCFDRVHRLGQNKSVSIYKFVTKDTIETRVVELQDKKRSLACGAYGGSRVSEIGKEEVSQQGEDKGL